MKQILTLLFSLSLLSSFSQIGTFKKVETNELRLRTMLNSDITKFLTTDANGKVVLATVSGGGAASRFGIEDNTSDVNRLFKSPNNTFSFIVDNAIDLNSSTNYTKIYPKGFEVYLNDDAGNGSDFYIEPGTLHSGTYSNAEGTNINIFPGSFSINALTASGSQHAQFTIDGSDFTLPPKISINQSSTLNSTLNNTQTFASGISGNYTIPLSVNGIYADATGNIDLSGGASLNKSLGTFASYNTTQRNYLPNFTPRSSKDKRGEIGRVTFDENFEYIKTEKGWKRLPLSNF